MKLLPIPLSPLGGPPLGMWNSDLLWRYPTTPTSPLADLKTQLPPQLSSDPRIWGREEVVVFLRWTEREFDLPKFELDLFQMNGKALCLLTKNDLAERCPGAGDIIHNVLQLLIRDTQMLHRHLPSSPITPTNRYPLSPHSHPPTPNWSSLAPPLDNPFYANHLQHFMQSNSVTLSPAPSIDSQGGSPPNQEASSTVYSTNLSNENGQSSGASDSTDMRSNSASGSDSARHSGQNGTSSGSSSHHSDSEEESFKHKIPKLLPPPMHHKSSSLSHQKQSPPVTPINKEPPTSTSNLLHQHQFGIDFKPHSIFFNGQMDALNGNNGSGSSSTSPSTPNTPGYMKREFFPDTPTEPNTNGRLLWDFLQQLLNDHQQRYSNYIAWKCRDTGVFKIVDPAGLAKLWGIQKNHLSMNYDKMSRALRYYYRVNILRKVQGERHCYQFLRNPTELKSIKNISLLRQSMANQQQQQTSSSSNTSTTASSSQVTQAALQASALASLLPQSTTNFHHLTAALVQSKMEFNSQNNVEEEPHDLSTSSSSNERKFMGKDCYPRLIHGANGLTTIQLLRQHQESLSQGLLNSHTSPSSSPTSLSPPIHHLSLHKEHREHSDEDMPTDLRKNYD
ncbi:hypothetical protein ACKWTF_004825 [Chironomus riparius]